MPIFSRGYSGGISDETEWGAACDGEMLAPKIIYVNKAASSKGDGTSWKNAFSTVQQGVSAAAEEAGDCQPAEVWVAEGTYYIFESDKTDSLVLETNVYLLGGFAGTETDKAESRPAEHETILSGFSGPDALEDSRERVYTVLTGLQSSAVNGFTITGGNASGIYDYWSEAPAINGGGLLGVNAKGKPSRFFGRGDLSVERRIPQRKLSVRAQ